jgi:hypothetical protein
MSKEKRIKVLGKVDKTERGFHIIEFKDHYGKPCSLQESSLAVYQKPGSSALWLGVNEGVGNRMHLTVDQVEALVRHLSHWLEEGTLA